MQWKRMLRYLIWLVYTIAVGSLAVGVTSLLCIREGLGAYWGIVFTAAYAMVAAGGVALLCRTASGITLFAEKNRSLFVVLEAIVAVTFLVMGLLFRLEGIPGAAEGEIYYDMAKVAVGHEIPKIVHGAVYLYLQLLHMVFELFGNYFAAGIWIQIILQMTASVVLFFVVRKLVGAVAGLVTLGGCMCAPYMVRNALMLSPEMLYFFFLTAALAIMMAGYTGKLKPWPFFFMGIVIAIYGYMDIIGFLLLVPAFGMVYCCQEERPSGKMKAVVFCIAGLGIGFLSCVFLDAVLSGTSPMKVAQAWILLYSPESFRVPVAVEGVASDVEGIVLLGFMVFGIFSFWHNPEKERMTACVLASGIIILAGSYGIFTNEMPGAFSLYVLFMVLAGVGVGQCFYAAQPEEETGNEAETYDTMPDFLTGEIQEAGARKKSNIRTAERAEKDMCRADTQEESNMYEADTEEKSGVYGADMHEVNIHEEFERFADSSDKKVVKYIENPLPLPKKHEKRVLEYAKAVTSGEEDFDHTVTSDDDFDI